MPHLYIACFDHTIGLQRYLITSISLGVEYACKKNILILRVHKDELRNEY